MNTLIYINACMMPGSRTLRIANTIVSHLEQRYAVETIDLRDTYDKTPAGLS